jgi:hypothetical protein
MIHTWTLDIITMWRMPSRHCCVDFEIIIWWHTAFCWLSFYGHRFMYNAMIVLFFIQMSAWRKHIDHRLDMSWGKLRLCCYYQPQPYTNNCSFSVLFNLHWWSGTPFGSMTLSEQPSLQCQLWEVSYLLCLWHRPRIFLHWYAQGASTWNLPKAFFTLWNTKEVQKS